MKFSVLRYTLAFVAVATLAFSGDKYDSPLHMKNAPTWQERQSALDEILKRYSMYEPIMQSGIVQLFQRESRDPNWSDLAEEEPYDAYYDKLSELCQSVAQTYHNNAAWQALIFSNYNEDSNLGKWLAAQPEALPAFLQMLRDPNLGMRDRGIMLLAESLQQCNGSKNVKCTAVLTKRDEISSIIRRRIFTSPGEGIGIKALGICGTQEDLGLLENVAARQSARKIDPADQDARSDQQAVLWLVHNAEKQIKIREVNEADRR